MKLKRLLSLAMLCIVGISGAWAYNDGDDITTSVQTSWTNSSGDFQTGRERYNGASNFAVGKVLYMTTNAVESSGYYEVEFYASANHSNWSGNENVKNGLNIAQAYLGDGTYGLNILSRTSCTFIADENLYKFSTYANAGEKLEFGIKNIAEGGNWYVAKLKSVVFKGTKATKNNPIDVSFRIENREASYNGVWAFTKANYNNTANERYDGQMLEVSDWGANSFEASATQTLSNLPVGYYKLSSVVMASADAQVQIKLGNHASDWKNGHGTSGGDTGKFGWDNITIEGIVSGNTTIGVYGKTSKQHNWTNWDHFQLFYYGNGVENYATELPAGATTADNWYAFRINVASDYKITSSAAATIKYTQDGTLEPSAVTTPIKLAAGASSETIHLEPGILYLSSNAASTITVAADSKIYSVGTATANMAFAQPGQTVTITYADATTNDGAASFAKNGTPNITFGSESVTATPTSNGFTFVVPNVAAGTDYTLAIPANAFGYAAGNTYNEAQNITIKTPAIYDGTYYFKNTQSQKYLSRGMEYGTEAIVDDFGLAVILRTDADGNTTFKFFDNQLYIGKQGWAYGDYGTPMKFLASKTGDGYEFRNMDKNNANTEFLAQVIENKVVTDARKGDNLYGTSNVWTIETVEQHKANYTRNADNQAKAAAEAAGINASTAEALETVLASYTEKPVTITGAKAEKFQQYASDAQTLKENEYYKEVVENLTPGIYKLTVDAYQRAAHNDWVADNGGARGLIYLYANGAKTQLKSVFEYGADVAYSNDFARDGKHYPNGQGAGYDALETGNYQNVVYVYVPADNGKTTGTLTIGINNPVRQANGDAGKTATWALYNNWNLTLYSADPFNEVVDGVRSYYGKYVSGLEIELTNEVPTVDLTNATISGTVTVTPTNTNGLVYAKAGQNISGVENNIVVDGTCANLVLTDGGTFKAHKNFEATNASYNMTAVAGDKFGTLMLPFAVSTKPTDRIVYVLDKGISFGEEIQASTTDAIAANTPVLVTKAGNYTASNVPVAATNDTYTNGELVGTYKAKTAEEGTFVLQNHSGRVAFYIVKGSTPTVNPFRAYIKAQSAGVAPRYISVNFGDETGIEDMEIATGENVIYDLSGRKVVKAEKGLYIVNGKKVLVK